MYKKIKIENFRGISSLELNDTRQFNLFMGKNSCGKTSLLESIFLLSGPTNAKLPLSINGFRGIIFDSDYSWRILFYNLDSQTPIRLYGVLSKTGEKRELIIKPLYEGNLTTSPDFPDLTIKDNHTIPSSKINGLSMKCSIHRNSNKEPLSFDSEISIGKEGVFNIGSPKDFLYLIPAQFISPATSDVQLAKQFSEIQIKKEEKNILKVLQKVEPQLANLSMGAENILYCDVGLKHRLPLNVIGEGVKKILTIILSIYNMSGGVILIDEIENGLHYSIQEILWEAIFEAAIAFNVQVFAATHSYENIKSFSAAYEKSGDRDDKLRLFRMESEKDKVRVIDFDHKAIDMAIKKNWEVR